MKLEVKVDGRLTNLFKIDINNVIQKALVQSSLIIQNKAKDIAPYLSGDLKSSIEVDYSKIGQLYTIIGSRLSYARVRNFVNFKNPQTLRYMFRGYEETQTEVKKIFKDVMGTIFK